MRAMKNIIKISITILLLAAFGTNISFAAKPTGGGGGGKIKVTGASPGAAPQGTSVTVTIAGENFEEKSSVTFLVGGTKDYSHISVGEVRFKNSTTLEADIDVNSGALTVDYDIEVQAISGRKGKGTTLFKVEKSDESTSCIDKPSDFPAFAYTTITGGGGSPVVGFDIYLSNADGDCSELLHSVSANESEIDLSYRQSGDSGIIAWRQNGDENAGGRKGKKSDDTKLHDVIRVIRFETSGKEIISPLPLLPDTVANSGDRWLSFQSIELSANGNRILIYHFDGITRADEDVGIQTIREMDIFNCSSDCAQTVLYTSSDIENFHNVSYSPSGNRIYFSGGIHTNSSDPRASQGYISFIEFENGTWSDRRDLTFEGNGFYGSNYSGSGTFREIDVALVDLGDGVPREVLSHTFVNVATNYQLDVHVIDVGSCSINGTEDCVLSGESSLVLSIADAKFPSFNNGPSSSTLLFSADSAEQIIEYDFLTEGVSVVALGNESDTGN